MSRYQKLILKLIGEKKAVSRDSVKKEATEAISAGFEGTSKPDYAVSRVLKNLIETGLAEELAGENDIFLRITSEGKKRLTLQEISDSTSPIPATWDGLWRIIILDLPEERKNEREALRYLLKKAGFKCVKNTVWVSPYPFEHLFKNIKKDLGLTTEMMILVTDSVDEETAKIFRADLG